MSNVPKPEHKCEDGCKYAKSSENWQECHYKHLPFENLQQAITHGGCDLFKEATP